MADRWEYIPKDDRQLPSTEGAERGGSSPPEVPKPISGSVLWTPRAWDDTRESWGAAGESAVRDIDIFVFPGALRKIATHLSTPGGREGYGMLSGRLCHCPESDSSYLTVEAAHSSPRAMPEGEDPAGLSAFREFWLATSMQVSLKGRLLVGWYHAHPRLGISFSRSDQRIHNAHFPNRWQCALVLTSGAAVPEGGFFQRDSGTGAFHSTPAPFYEILPHDGRNGDRVTSSVGWHNYRPDRAIATAHGRPREAGFELVSLEDSDAMAEMAEDERSANGGEGVAGRANGDVDSAETGGAPVPPDLIPQLLEAGRARRRRRRIRRLAIASTLGIIAVAGLAGATATGRLDLAGVTGDVRLRSQMMTRSLARTLFPMNENTADGQAGAIPMARGQSPGAPSADNDMSLARPPDEVRRLLDEIAGYEGARAGMGGRPEACATLRSAFGRVEEAAVPVEAAVVAGTTEVPEIGRALADVRRDFAQSGCATAE